MEAKKNTAEDSSYRFSTDPTSLTTAQLLREIGSLKELVFTRLDAVEQAIAVAHDDLVRVPTETQKAVGGLKELMENKIGDSDKLKEEKFWNLEKRLDLVEQARVEQKKDTATAVDAALKAAKEAVTEQNASNVLAINKSEAAMTKQMDTQAALISQVKNGLEDKINDIKFQLSKGEGKGQGTRDFMEIVKFIILIAAFLVATFVIKR